MTGYRATIQVPGDYGDGDTVLYAQLDAQLACRFLLYVTDEQKQRFLCAVVGGLSGDDEFLGERVVSGAPGVCVLGPPAAKPVMAAIRAGQ